MCPYTLPKQAHCRLLYTPKGFGLCRLTDTDGGTAAKPTQRGIGAVREFRRYYIINSTRCQGFKEHSFAKVFKK